MPMKVALRVTLKASLPMTDSSPEAYRDGIQKLEALKLHAEQQGFGSIETTVAVGNVRVPAPAAAKSAPDRAGAAGEAAVAQELGGKRK